MARAARERSEQERETTGVSARTRTVRRIAFGTDGIRGRAFSDIDEVVVHALGRAANRALSGGARGCRWLIGRDTRESGPALSRALAAGLRATGADVSDLGVVPTPVVAFAAEAAGAAGAMVSASHNPWHDNGVKLFGPGGTKLDDAAESAVSQCLDDLRLIHGDRPSATDVARRGELVSGAAGSAPVGDASRVLADYEASLRDAIDGRMLDGLHLVVDGANGASALLAPAVLRRLGAQVTALFCGPDGRNINDGCGSVHPAALQAAVTDQDADLGLAFDGDGDRLIAVDCEGGLINGDRQMALFAVDLAERGLLVDNTLVVTVMSNLGLRRAVAVAGINLVETAVGDRSVLEVLDAGGYSLGGEQSGHLIFRHEATTGDGLRSAVHLADLVARRGAAQPGRTSAAVSGGSALASAELASAAMVEAPQVLLNVPAATGSLDGHTRRAIDELSAAAGPDVRVLVRPSGTEPVIRVMVEATAERDATALADLLVELVSSGSAADAARDQV
ncbi:phosphoglucosamine mutase [Candidatus Poriferisodalis sp.]|uniref:phosphoglucosamine mutase n=1 Tax=Candidatus Poriferisodalis sp. TaxID=3101277 RepID=UPI003B0278CC